MDKRTPNPIDAHVGARIRLRRKRIGVSQQALGDFLSLTFQQVQKYEKGANRVSASMLYATAQKLEVPVSYFFEGLEQTGEAGAGADLDAVIVEFIGTDGALELAEAYAQLSGAQRNALRRIAVDLAQLEGRDGDANIAAVARERRGLAHVEGRA